MLKVQFSLLCISTFINNKNSRYDTVIGMYLLFFLYGHFIYQIRKYNMK